LGPLFGLYRHQSLIRPFGTARIEVYRVSAGEPALAPKPAATPVQAPKHLGSTAASRTAIIQTVQTPLGFFVLVVLVVEGIIGVIAGISDAGERSTFVFVMAAIIVSWW
jgi:hypothetical protein